MAYSHGLIRTFSSSNLHASMRIHEYVSSQKKKGDHDVNLSREVTKSSMVMPTLRKIAVEHDGHLARYSVGLVVDANSLESLEQDGIINWCQHARTLIPLNTDSDGNCLLHALSIYIWGVHDRQLSLRNFLHQKLQMTQRTGNLYIRWKCAQEELLRNIQTSLASLEFRRDWETVVRCSSSIEFPMENMGQKYFSLEDIHIFTMSNILARPIIVLSERVHHSASGGSLQPNQISGIYLPLLRDPYNCERSPVVIGYVHGHFMPLLSGEDLNMLITKRYVHPDAQHCIPLVYNDLTDIPVRFLMPNETRLSSLRRYLDCFNMPMKNGVSREAVILKFRSPPAWSVELMFSLYCKAQETFHEHTSSVSGAAQTAGSFTTSAPSNAYDPAHSFRGRAPHLSRLSNSQVHSQAARNWCGKDMTLSAAQPATERIPCADASNGCNNFGEERFNRFCRECYFRYFSRRPSNRHDDMDVSESYVSSTKPSIPLTKPSTPFTREELKVPEPQGTAAMRERVAAKCIISRCSRQGKPEFRDMCEGCFRERHNKPGEFERNEVGSGSTRVSGKIFCADPGCQEEIVEGTNKCREHLYNRPICITENCGKRAVDSEVPLCSECKRKNVEACRAHSIKPPPGTQLGVPTAGTHANKGADFSVPTIYSGFNKEVSSKSKGTSPQREYHQPEWQNGLEPQKSSKPATCVDPACGNYAAQGKDSLCNECYALKVSILVSERESRGNEMLTGRPASGQQFVRETQAVTSSSVSAAVRSQISAQVRKASPGEIPPSPQLSSTRNDDWLYGSQGTFSARRNSEGNVPYGADRVSEAHPNSEGCREPEINYERRRNHDIEHIYSEIDPPYMEREVFYRENNPRRPANRQISPGRPREPPRMQGGFVNEGYVPGVYSVIGERNQTRVRCARCGGVCNGEDYLDGLCETCHTESRREEEEDRFQAPKKPFINQKPCKTRGCPRFAEGSHGDFCETCLLKGERNPPENAAPFSGSEVSSSYAVGTVESRREASSAGRAQPNVCATTFCDFFASGEFGSYCSKCFMERTKLDIANPIFGGDPLTNPTDSQRVPYFSRGPASDSKECRREGCDHFGRPERNGYCSQCYELFF